MKTLVTGASGHLGSNLIRELLAQGREVRAMVRHTSSLKGLKGLNIELVKGDIRDPVFFRSAVKGCDTVYHTAAVFASWLPHPEIIIETAMEGTKNLFEAVIFNNTVKKIVYTSSTAAIGMSHSPDKNRNESCWNTDEITPYTSAKTRSEQLAWELFNKHNVPLTVVNPSVIFGPNDYKPTPSNSFILHYLKHGLPFYITMGLNIVDVQDIAKGHILAEKKGRVGERYILAGDNVMVKDVLKKLADMTGCRPPVFKLPKLPMWMLSLGIEGINRFRKKHPKLTRKIINGYFNRYSFYTSAKAENELGYTHRSIDDVLFRAVEWFSGSSWLEEPVSRRIKENLFRRQNQIKNSSSFGVP